MTGLIGLFGLFAIAIFIGLLGMWSSGKRKEVRQFYQTHSLTLAPSVPAVVLAAIGERSKPSCSQGTVTTRSGDEISFYWWEWFISSQTYSGSAPQTSIQCFLAISFPPFTISEESERNAVKAMRGRTTKQKLKAWFVLDTHTPYRAEKLADGSFLICWHVLQQGKVMDDKWTWLQDNISAHPIKKDKAVFFRHDSYAMLQHTFSTAWPNLSIELHYSGPKLDKEGWDEFDESSISPDLTTANYPLFPLNDDTTAAEAMRLFSQHYGGEAFILKNGVSVPERETLADCNTPFTLPLNQYTYGEFKRRFSGRWPKLSIQLYDSSPFPGGLGENAKPLADDFDMTNLKNVEKAFLHDYLYISDWGTLLGHTDIFATIKPSNPETPWDRNSIQKRLRDF